MHDPPDEDLVRRIQAGGPERGDAAAETILYNRYVGRVRFMLREQARDHALAEDLAQETFLIVIRKLRRDGLNIPERLWSYTHSTADNVYIGWVRKQNRHPAAELDDTLRDMNPSPEQVIHQEMADKACNRLIDELPTARDREYLKRWAWGEDEAEIRAALKLSAEHGPRVKHRALQRFRKSLEDLGFDPDTLRPM